MLAFAVTLALAVGGAATLEPAPELAPAPAPALAELAAPVFAFAFAPAPPLEPVLGLTRVIVLALALAAAPAPELVISTTGVAEEEAEGSCGAAETSVANAVAKDDAPPRLPSPWLARIDFGRGRLCYKSRSVKPTYRI
jgi:hypothetical protein